MRRWIQYRTDTVRRKVSAYDVLRRNGITLRHSTDREEQFPCPFHGVDTHPSARIYPETVKGPSHVWCFVCQEHWDSIGLWKKFTGTDAKFTRVIAELERAFGITPPERPPSAAEMAEHEDPETIEVETKIALCEEDLKSYQHVFDMRAHLTLGSVLDRVRYQFERAMIPPAKALDVLDQIQKKIVDKERAWVDPRLKNFCPEG
jgi:hypothetical protein